MAADEWQLRRGKIENAKGIDGIRGSDGREFGKIRMHGESGIDDFFAR